MKNAHAEDLETLPSLPLDWFQVNSISELTGKPLLLCQRLFRLGILDRRLSGHGLDVTPEYRRLDADADAMRKQLTQLVEDIESPVKAELDINEADKNVLSAQTPAHAEPDLHLEVERGQSSEKLKHGFGQELPLPSYAAAAKNFHRENDTSEFPQKVQALVDGVKVSVERSGGVARKLMAWL